MSLRPAVIRSLTLLSSGVVLGAFWPAACARGGAGPQTAAPSAQPSLLGRAPVSFLPHPAFAYAQGTTATGVTISDIAERALPSVVNIASTRQRKLQAPSLPFGGDPFRWFFGPGPGPGPGAPGPMEPDRGLGSGVIVSQKTILTNYHVVEGADQITVTTGDQRELDAEVVGTDPKSDLAVLEIKGNPEGLQPIEFGDSSRLRLGDVVLAIGNPFGVGQTVTMGIVSAKGRANVGIVDYEDFIQTDAAINPGNSGGALVDMEGKLVGVPTAILSRTGGYMGIGFAIPTNMVKPIMQSLIDHGRVVRGWLGIAIQDIDRDLAKALQLPSTKGVLVSDVQPDSPAAKAGLRRGDVVLSIDGTSVDSTGRLRNVIAAAGANRTVRMELLRNGKPETLEVKLGEMPAEVAGQPGPGKAPPGTPGSVDGLTVEELGPSVRQRFNLPDTVKQGVVITGVAPSSAGARAGLRPGDVVLEVDRKRVDSVAAFQSLWRQSKGRTLLLVEREGSSIYLVVKR